MQQLRLFVRIISARLPSGMHLSRLVMLILSAIACVGGGSAVQAQGPGPGSSLPRVSIRPILVEVELIGADNVDAALILSQMQTQPTTDNSLTQLFGSYARLLSTATLAPPGYAEMFQSTVDSLREIRYLNTATVAADTSVIRTVYNDFGYHDAKIAFEILIDTARNTAAVHYLLEEGERYPVKAITYMGIDSIPQSVQQQIRSSEELEPGEPFENEKLAAEVERVRYLLRSNGYAFDRLPNTPAIIIRRDKKYDSIVVYLFPGRRYRFGRTQVVVDSSRGGRSGEGLREQTVLRQLEFSPGEWYSKQKIDQSVSNLYSLGIFESVRIDTAAALMTDDSLGMRVTVRLRNPLDIAAAADLSVEQKVRSDYVTKLGASSNLSYLNFLGLADRFSLALRGEANLPELTEFEGGVTGKFQWPSIFNIVRLNFALSGSYDLAVENQLEVDGNRIALNSERIALIPELSRRLPDFTFFSLVSGRINYQRNRYFNVRDYTDGVARVVLDQIAEAVTLDTSGGGCDIETIRKEVADLLRSTVFRQIVLQGDDAELIPENDESARPFFDDLKRTLTFGLSAISDKRNDYFSPTKGHFLQLSTDLGFTGLPRIQGSFLRWNLDARLYGEAPMVAYDASYAARMHLGLINEFGQLPLTPNNSRFWAGGANSLRGWGFREMLVTTPPAAEAVANENCTVLDTIIQSITSGYQNIIGGLMVVEISGELRFPLFRLPNTSTLNKQLNELIGIAFVDIGNAYFRDYDQDADLVSLKSIITNLGLAAGFNLGYNTPIGPVRVGFGWPLHDPVNHSGAEAWVWNRPLSTSDWAWQISIGHAF